MSKKFTLTECYELLQADPKTFRRWLKKAGIHEQVKSQISKADDRVKYLTQEQLEEIATLHERQLPLEIAETEQLAQFEEITTQTVQFVLAEDTAEHQDEQFEEIASLLAAQVEDEVTKPIKKSDQHAHKGSSKKFSIKPGAYKLIVDQLDELQQLQNESSNLALVTQKLLDEQEKAHQQALEQLQASSHEKIATLETTIQLQQEQFEILTVQISNQSTQFDQYKISLTENEAVQTQRLHLLEGAVTQSQQNMDRSLKTLRSEMVHQKEQIHAALQEAQQEIKAQITQQHNEHQVEIHTLGEQVNSHIITLMERLNETTELIKKELYEETEARKQLAKQVTTLSSSRPATNRSKATNQPATTAKEEL